MTGYHAVIKGSSVTVFGPDGTEIGSAARRGYSDALVGRVGDTRLVSDGYGDGRLSSFAMLAARHHRAAVDPGVRDKVWVRWEEDGVAAVYGTDKYDDDDRRAVKAGNLYWSGQRQGWATGRKWNPGTRDRNLAAVLRAFARQDRNIVVLGPGQTPQDLVASPTAAAAVPVQQAPPAAPAPPPEPEPEPLDLTGLSYEELVEAEGAAAVERSRNFSAAAEDRFHAVRQERGRRLLDRVTASAPVTEMRDEDLATESEWWQANSYRTPFLSSDEEYRTLERHYQAVRTEQYARISRVLLAGPAAADLDDEALESTHEQIGRTWTRLPRDHELHDQVADYRRAVQEERTARRARSYGERTPVGEMTLEDLIAENAELASSLNARNEQSAYSYSEAVREARAQRLQAVEAEWFQRGMEQHPEATRASLGGSIAGRRTVLIDGSVHTYGYVERQGRTFRALADYDQRSSIGDFDSAPAAMAALVQRYDQDPETLPRRTWGLEREVTLPVSSYEPLVSWLRRRPSELSREYDRVLTLLTPYQLPTQTKVVNPLTNQVMRAYLFDFEEGLLGELARIAERTTEDLREQSLDENLPRREREAAKRRIPAMGAALIGINAVIEQVRAAGGDVERRGVDQSRLAAQMAALTGTVNEQEGGPADGDDEPVRDASAQALGGVPAAGAGGDAGPGRPLPEAGGADERGDRRGGGGPGGDPGAGDGLPGPGRTAGADQGDGAGAGAARDAAAAGGRGQPGGAAESGSGGAGEDPQGAGEPVARFRPDPADLPRGPLARAEANLEAVKVLRTLESDRRGATAEEKRVLARWSGWGSVLTVFLDEPDPDEPIYRPGGEWEGRFEADHARWESYDRVRGELQELLDPFEWRAASRAVLSAHYTPQGVAEAMWQGLAAYGFDGGEVLEAGCGSGAFFGVAPQTARLTGVEVDPTTAAIAARIYPHANVLSESFTDTDAPAGTFDLVIGNVPFAQAPFGERRYGATGHSLHNGFIIKQLALLRPGGYMAVITSRWTLDGEDTSARRAMSRWGDLAAAYRLPAGTFGETADTDVVADVLVFRRRAQDEEPGDQTWIDAPERDLGGNTLTVNAYFTEHPEHVLGRLTSETGPYGPRVTVQGDPGEAPRLLRERMEASAAAAVADGQGYVPHEDGPDRAPLLLQTAREKHATDFTGRLYTDDHGQIWQHVNGEGPVRVIAADGVTGTEQLRMLLSLRDTASELQELDRTGSDPDRAREVRSQLARLHAAYTTAHGPLSRPRQTRMALPTDEARAAARAAGAELDDHERLPTGWGWFRQDPHAAVVLGLEHWDRANDRPVPSEVLTRRPGARRDDLEPTDDPKTALTAVMGATGSVDLPLIASLLGTTPEEARRRLGTEVFDNPVTKKLEHAGAYLSGPVRVKLEQAREAAATDPTYAVNVAALEAVQPPPKRLGQFTAQLGAHWIPAFLVQGFLREYLGDPTLQVSHNERYGWSLAAGKVPDAINALKGTERRSAVHIAKALLGRASMVVNTLDGDGVDEDATRAMRYKADAMRSAFEDYCTASTARVTLLTDAYNRQMNGHVVRSYDGLAPTLAGLTTERTPHPWQLSAAARMQFERGVVLAHEMGLGKTTTMVMGSQALKASGQITKPFAVVQPHLARQWLDEAKLLYPNADIHLITSDDLADGNRRRVLEWLRANTPDLVIFTEGAFGSIRMSPEQQELYLFREIESLKEQLKRERGVPHNAFALMQLERRLTTVETRIRRNAAPMRTPGEVYWEDLGFDYALVDEAHRFTAVGFRSKEAGGEAASVRAVDMHQKLRWHHQVAELHGGRPTVTLGTGTPMENSIFEQYSVLELATPWLLDQFGVHGPDLWAETFGQKVQRIEMAPDGSGLTIVERFSRFVSKSTMKTMWGLAADTKTGDDVGIVRPKLAGGAPELVLVEPTADQRARLQTLVARGQAIHAGEVTREEDNMLAVSGEGRAVALDPRLVDAGAPAANKLVTAADIIAAGYHAHKDRTYAVSSRNDTLHPVPGGLFFLFCNSGTPGGNNKGGFDLYAELRDLLAARGVPRDMVQFAQDHHTPEKKAAMTEAANNGGIAVLMGSSEVLGTGFNGQNRAYALMHLDQDWTPAMMMQRDFRVLRPGNQHEEVNIYFLATKGSMDAWQVGLLTSKAEGLRDIQRPPGEGDDDNDTVEEIGASDWDYATMAAEIGGNPFMRQFMEAKVHLQGLEADRRNAAADRVRQAELLLAKENELASTQRAIALRDAALPKVTATIRGDAFQIRVGGRDFDKRGEAGPLVRQAVADALRGHSSLGTGPWTTIGTFGGLDFAVRPEILDGGSEIRAHVGFPDLRHSEFVCSIGDLANPRFGGTIIGRLATALEKAENHQLMDRERLPVLEAEITLLTAQQASIDYGPAIEHARRRVELLDAVVGAITERDKFPELTESMLDPERYRTPESRKKAIAERVEQRAPHQAKVDQAAAALAAFDETAPAPELPTAPAPAPHPAPTPAPVPVPAETAARPTRGSGSRPAEGAQVRPEPEDGSTEEPPQQTSEPPGDAYGTANLYEEFGLTPPDHVPNPALQDETEPDTEAEETDGVPEGQMTVEEVQSEAASADPVDRRPDSSAAAPTDVEQPTQTPAPDQPRARTEEGAAEQLGLFGDPAVGGGEGPASFPAQLHDGESVRPGDRENDWIVTSAGGVEYRLRGIAVGTADEFWIIKTLPEAPDTGRASDAPDDQTPDRLMTWLRTDSANRALVRERAERHPALPSGEIPFTLEPVVTQLEDNYWRVTRYGVEGRVSRFHWGFVGHPVEQPVSGGTPDGRGMRREYAIWSSTVHGLSNTPTEDLQILGPHFGTTKECAAHGPGFAGSCQKTDPRLTVELQGAGPVVMCVAAMTSRLIAHTQLLDAARELDESWTTTQERAQELVWDRAGAAQRGESLPPLSDAWAAMIEQARTEPERRSARPRRASGGRLREAAVAAPTLEDVAPDDAPATAALPELDVVLQDVDLATLAPGEPYDVDEEARADIDRLTAAFTRWEALPTVQRYYEADQQQRPDGDGDPTNPIAQLAAAYRDAEQSLRDSPAGSLDDLLLHIHTVAVWSGALEPAVDEDLRGPLGQVREAAALLATRSRATVAAFEAELAALAADSAEQSPAVPERAAPEAETAEQPAGIAGAPETRTESGPDDPAAATGATQDTPAPGPQEAQESPAGVGPAPGDPVADITQDTEPAGAVLHEEMHETRREAPSTGHDRPQTADGDLQTPEPGTAAAPTAPAPAEEDAPSDETAQDASEEPTMTTPPVPETADTPGEPLTEEPPEPQRYFETIPFTGDLRYRLRLSGLDGQPVDSGQVLQGDLVIATVHRGTEGGWVAQLATEGQPSDVTYPADTPQDAAAWAAVMYSAFTGVPYGPPLGPAAADESRQRVDVLRANLREVALEHRAAFASAAAQPAVAQNPHLQELVGSLDGLAAAVAESYSSQQMTQHIDAVQQAVNAWGAALPTDPGHPERRQLAFPLAYLLYDSRRLHEHVQATLAAAQAERAAVHDQKAAAAPETTAPETTTAQTALPVSEASGTPVVPDSQSPKATQDTGPQADTATDDGRAAQAGPDPVGAAPTAPDPARPLQETVEPAASASAQIAVQRPEAAADSVRQAGDETHTDAPELVTSGPDAVEPTSEELPLSTTTESRSIQTNDHPADMVASFSDVMEAWNETIPAEQGTAADLWASVEADLRTLQQQLAEAVAGGPPEAAPDSAPGPSTQTTLEAPAAPGWASPSALPADPDDATHLAQVVNVALQQADAHASTLQQLPEWQRIQTVRGAFTHLWRVIRERAGEHWGRLLQDDRVGNFFRGVGVRVCEGIASWAQRGADRLRRSGQEALTTLPSAEALLRLGDAALAYSGRPHSAGTAVPSVPVSGREVDVPTLRRMGQALARPLPAQQGVRTPPAPAGPRVSAAAARARSNTVARRPAGPASSAEQADHLRRSSGEQQPGRRPNQR
ncbi:hypothetical protein [Streptomyces sp. NPDC053367]|uniref:hypothetical protein n=1 Tax=Streptomyces sp. NPDC053367 TaxID=3365700 RepID=UPI0037CEA40F